MFFQVGEGLCTTVSSLHRWIYVPRVPLPFWFAPRWCLASIHRHLSLSAVSWRLAPRGLNGHRVTTSSREGRCTAGPSGASTAAAWCVGTWHGHFLLSPISICVYVTEKDVGRLPRAELDLITWCKAECRQKGGGNLPSYKDSRPQPEQSWRGPWRYC